MRKKFLPIPLQVDLSRIAKSVKKTGNAQINPVTLRSVQAARGLEGLGMVYDLVELLKLVFYISRNYKVKKD